MCPDLKLGHLSSLIRTLSSVPSVSGFEIRTPQLTNQDTFFCPKGVRIRDSTVFHLHIQSVIVHTQACTVIGRPSRVVNLGETFVPKDVFMDYLFELSSEYL